MSASGYPTDSEMMRAMVTAASRGDWSLRLARLPDAAEMPAIEAAAGALFQHVEGLAGIAGTHTLPVEKLLEAFAILRQVD